MLNRKAQDPPGRAEQTCNISLIVPNLNEAPYLRKFLWSLAAQRFGDFELILIDGGSTDESLEICERFQGKFPIRILIDRTPNIGFIRNLGSKYARGEILFHTSSDVILDLWLLNEIAFQFMKDPRLVSLTGRTKPVGSQLLCHVAYQSFDLLRWLFTKLPGSLRKFRPGGNFLAIRKNIFNFVLGFPEVAINEDGLLGQKLDLFLLEMAHGYKVKFDLGLYVHHHVKRFEQRGSLKTILFYLYVLGNMAPILKPLLYKIEAHSAEVFKSRSDLRDFKRK